MSTQIAKAISMRARQNTPRPDCRPRKTRQPVPPAAGRPGREKPDGSPFSGRIQIHLVEERRMKPAPFEKWLLCGRGSDCSSGRGPAASRHDSRSQAGTTSEREIELCILMIQAKLCSRATSPKLVHGLRAADDIKRGFMLKKSIEPRFAPPAARSRGPKARQVVVSACVLDQVESLARSFTHPHREVIVRLRLPPSPRGPFGGPL